MAHEIKADSNTSVGYNFLTEEFYVKNLDTTVVTKKATDAKIILDITAPGNTVPLEDIVMLSETLEPITSINYTLEDNGKYIKTISFNDYKTYAMQYDEPSLYIRGSNEMWDMSSTIGVNSVSLFMWQFYVYHLGLEVPKKLMDRIINYFHDIQKPYVYNTIKPQTEDEELEGKPLMYTNQFIMNNADGSSRGEYTGTKNPDNIYTLNVYNIVKAGFDTIAPTYEVSSIEKGRSRINMLKLLPEGTFNVTETIEIIDTENNNGKYTITEIKNDYEDLENPVTHITVAEKFTEDYAPYHNRHILRKIGQEQEINERSITCEEEPVCDTGDVLQVIGKTEHFDNLVVDHVSGKKIYVKSDISRLTQEDEARVWINAYGITQAGFVEKDEIKSSQQISKIIDNKIYMYDILTENQYVPNEKIFISINEKLEEYTIVDVTLSTFNTNGMVQGYLTIDGTPDPYIYILGADPAYVQIRNKTKYAEDSITLTAPFPLAKGDTFEIINADTLTGIYEIEDVQNNKVFIKSDEPLPEITFDDNNKGIAQIRKYSERILLDISYSRLANKIPTGTFMLDNNQQFTEYLELYRIVTPTNQNYVDLSQPVTMKYYLGENLLYDDAPTYMNCLGLYSKNYKNL